MWLPVVRRACFRASGPLFGLLLVSLSGWLAWWSVLRHVRWP